MSRTRKLRKLFHVIKNPVLKFLTVATAIELIFYFAFIGAVHGAKFGSHYHFIGNTGGYILGSILGGTLAGTTVFLLRKAILKLAEIIGDENELSESETPTPNSKQDYIRRLGLTKDQFLALKQTFIRMQDSLDRKNEIWRAAWRIKLQSAAAKYTSLTDAAPNPGDSKTSIVTSSDDDHDEVDINAADDAELSNEDLERGVQVGPNVNQQQLLSRFLQFLKFILNKVKIPVFKYVGGSVAVGTIIYCAYYGGVIVSHEANTIAGNIFGFMSGAILGAALATVFVYFVGKAIISLDNKINSVKAEDIDPTLEQELKTLRVEIRNSKQQLFVLQAAVNANIQLIQNAIAHNSSTTTSSLSTFPTTSSPAPALIIPVAPAQNEITDETPTFFQRIKEIIFKFFGIPAAAGTIISTTYYGALIGSTVGKGIPEIGALGGFIGGGFSGAFIAAIGVYMAAKGIIKLDKYLSGTDDNSKILRALNLAENELRFFKRIMIELQTALQDKIAANPHQSSYGSSPSPMLTTATSVVVPEITGLARINTRNSGALAQSDISSAFAAVESTPLLQSVNQDETGGIINAQNENTSSRLKEFFQYLWEKVKGSAVKLIGGTVALFIIGLCTYYGVLLGGALGAVAPELNSLLWVIICGVIGACYGIAFAVLGVTAVVAIDNQIKNDKYDEVSQKFATVMRELGLTYQELNTLQQIIKLAESTWGPSFDTQSHGVWLDRAEGEIGTSNTRKLSGKNLRLNARSGGGTDGASARSSASSLGSVGRPSPRITGSGVSASDSAALGSSAIGAISLGNSQHALFPPNAEATETAETTAVAVFPSSASAKSAPLPSVTGRTRPQKPPPVPPGSTSASASTSNSGHSVKQAKK